MSGCCGCCSRKPATTGRTIEHVGVFVFLPLLLSVTAWPIARLAEQHLHPRNAARLLTWVGALLAVCSTLCLGLIMVVGTAQLPGNPLPDAWSDPEVRAAVPHDEVAGRVAIPALMAVAASCAVAVWHHVQVRRRAHGALAGLPAGPLVLLPTAFPTPTPCPALRAGSSCRRQRGPA